MVSVGLLVGLTSFPEPEFPPLQLVLAAWLFDRIPPHGADKSVKPFS